MRTGLSVAVLLLLLPCAAAADGRHGASLVFPLWEIRLPEEPYVNTELESGQKRYPITNMFDGDLTTAWVYEGPKWDGQDADNWDRPLTGTAFLGGVAQWIDIRSLSPNPPLIDAVGIANGYAKSAAVYERNNRVTRVRLDGGGTSLEPGWAETADLQQVMWMQVVSIPETRADRVRLTVEAVERGPDDDLCISEIQLFHKGRAVIPRPTPFVLCSEGAPCGCCGSLELADSQCRRVWSAGDSRRFFVRSFHFSPNGRAAVLLGDADDGMNQAVAVVDLANGQHLFRERLDAYPVSARWLSDEQFEVTAWEWEETARTERRYRVDLSAAHAQLSQVPD